jgi:1,4-alpha-glucan branching enzyme
MSKPVGYLAFLLHAHLPFIRNTAPSFCLEEKWFFEVLTESYIPMLLSWERLLAEGADFKLTLSLSPPLLSMMVDPQMKERYLRQLRQQLELAERELARTAHDPVYRTVVAKTVERFRLVYDTYVNRYRQDLVGVLKRLAVAGCLELITTGATHGYLPLMVTEEAKRAQIMTGIDYFRRIFGWRPQGFWVSECAYFAGLEALLAEAGIKYFVMSNHGFMNAFPRPQHSIYFPVQTGGVAVFGRDRETSREVWSRAEGYPGDYNYREFYRDIGYDLDYDYIAPYLVDGIRGDTGFKYYRITGATKYKEVYDADRARQTAYGHAEDFIAKRERQFAALDLGVAKPPLITMPYDAELFGHWWFEGPDWLERVLRLSGNGQSPVRTITFSEYLQQAGELPGASFANSSWGEGGYSKFWLNPKTDWIYTYYNRAERWMNLLANSVDEPTPLQERALTQAARELMLAQSSDWAFIITSGTAVEYAEKRLHTHLTNFFKLCGAVEDDQIDGAELAMLEYSDRIFTDLDYRVYASPNSPFGRIATTIDPDKPLVLMLSWEYPPQHVGGLGVHVRNLSEALLNEGYNVHVITVAHDGKAWFNILNGVGVHYLPIGEPLELNGDFLPWVLQLNLAMADYGTKLLEFLVKRTQVTLHAHDWLVSYAARELKARTGLRLVTTIHATEYGRNGGITTQLQSSIHASEKALVAIADQVICCSKYMYKEIQTLFGVPDANLQDIPNGVRKVEPLPIPRQKRTILYLGRLVREKGVQYLIRALPGLIGAYPDLKLQIAGSGTYRRELEKLTQDLGLTPWVDFIGFVNEELRNRLLTEATVAVFPSIYEPFGIVALEAMSSGTPVIVAHTGGLAEIVTDGVTGLCFTPRDVADLERCLRRTFDDATGVAQRNLAAQELVDRKYTWESVAKATAKVYRTSVNYK